MLCILLLNFCSMIRRNRHFERSYTAVVKIYNKKDSFIAVYFRKIGVSSVKMV